MCAADETPKVEEVKEVGEEEDEVEWYYQGRVGVGTERHHLNLAHDL